MPMIFRLVCQVGSWQDFDPLPSCRRPDGLAVPRAPIKIALTICSNREHAQPESG